MGELHLSDLPIARPRPEVLVVDDEEIVSAFVEELLAGAGWSVTVAVSAEQALERLAGGRFDLVVLERQLPEMGGLDLLRRMLVRDPGLRAVVVAAHGSAEAAHEAFLAGAADFILKPIDDVDSFLSRLDRARDRGAPAPEAVRTVDPKRLPAATREALGALRAALGV